MKETKFKNTEIGIIPEDWAVNTLAELCSLITDGSHESPKDTEYGYYMPSVKDMRMNEFNFANCKKISEKDYLRLINNGCKPQKGDVLIAKDGSILKYSFTLKEDLPIVILSSIAIIRPRPTEIESEYLSLYFRQPKFIEQVLTDFKTGTGVPRIILRNFEKIQISYPYDLTGQYRIASALTSIDNLISSLGKLIEKKKNIKQGAMRQLLTGKTRLKGFNEPWVYRKISEVAMTSSGGTPSRSIISYYYGDINWFTTTELKDNYLYNSVEHITREALSNSSAKMFSANTILMAMYGATIGKLGILKEPSATNQACCAIKCNDIDEIFLFYILLYNRKSIIEKGCGAGQPNISQTIVNELSFLVPPCKKEQQAIATILTKMDDEITALEAKKTKYEAIKQGMMQQLLTGKIRLIS